METLTRLYPTWARGWAAEAAIFSFLGRPFFLFSTTSAPSSSSSAFLLLKARFLLMLAILSSLSLLVSSLDLTSFCTGGLSLGLPNKTGGKTHNSAAAAAALDLDAAFQNLADFDQPERWWVSHLSRGVSPVEDAMAVGAPGVALDRSVNRESRAFIGSILEAEVSSRHDFTLQHLQEAEKPESWTKSMQI